MTLTLEEQNKLVEDNLRLVGFMIQKFKDCGNGSYDFNDLMQVGNLAMIEAARRYDPEKAKFTTFASRYILFECTRYVTRNRGGYMRSGYDDAVKADKIGDVLSINQKNKYKQTDDCATIEDFVGGIDPAYEVCERLTNDDIKMIVWKSCVSLWGKQKDGEKKVAERYDMWVKHYLEDAPVKELLEKYGFTRQRYFQLTKQINEQLRMMYKNGKID